jgi:hypothetical protein
MLVRPGTEHKTVAKPSFDGCRDAVDCARFGTFVSGVSRWGDR